MIPFILKVTKLKNRRKNWWVPRIRDGGRKMLGVTIKGQHKGELYGGGIVLYPNWCVGYANKPMR